MSSELSMAGKMGPVDFDCCVLVPRLSPCTMYMWYVSQRKQPQIDLDTHHMAAEEEESRWAELPDCWISLQRPVHVCLLATPMPCHA